MAAVILHHISCASLFPLDGGPGMGGELGQVPVPLPGATRAHLHHLNAQVALKKTWEEGKSVFFLFP